MHLFFNLESLDLPFPSVWKTRKLSRLLPWKLRLETGEEKQRKAVDNKFTFAPGLSHSQIKRGFTLSSVIFSAKPRASSYQSLLLQARYSEPPFGLQMAILEEVKTKDLTQGDSLTELRTASFIDTKFLTTAFWSWLTEVSVATWMTPEQSGLEKQKKSLIEAWSEILSKCQKQKIHRFKTESSPTF